MTGSIDRRNRGVGLLPLLLTVLVAVAGMAPAARAGNLWLTGHDADFHCDGSGGSQCHYFGIAVNFIRQGAPTKTLPVLVLDSGTEAVNSIGATEVKALNTIEGAGNAIPFTVVDPSSPAFATTPISTANWSAIIIASDSTCGGCDNTTTDITAINARTSEIQAFFTAGGGLLYLAGADNASTYYNSVPIPATGIAVAGPFTVTSVGTSLGLTSTDANCCATHNSFTLPASGSALQIAETDSAGNAETLVASGASICSGTLCGGTGGGPQPIPTLSEWALVATAFLLVALAWAKRRRRDS